MSLSIPDDLLGALDSIAGGERQATRSEVVRQALNRYISEHCELERVGGQVIATITIIHQKSDRGQGLDLQHEFDDIVVQYHHTHLSASTCVEMMLVKGDSRRLRELVGGLRANRHVRQIKYFVMPAELD